MFANNMCNDKAGQGIRKSYKTSMLECPDTYMYMYGPVEDSY